jgi:hypothetical protein
MDDGERICRESGNDITPARVTDAPPPQRRMPERADVGRLFRLRFLL